MTFFGILSHISPVKNKKKTQNFWTKSRNSGHSKAVGREYLAHQITTRLSRQKKLRACFFEVKFHL